MGSFTATVIALALMILLFLLPVAAIFVATFSRNWVVILGTLLLSGVGFLISLQPSSASIPVAVGMQLGGLLLGIAGKDRSFAERN